MTTTISLFSKLCLLLNANLSMYRNIPFVNFHMNKLHALTCDNYDHIRLQLILLYIQKQKYEQNLQMHVYSQLIFFLLYVFLCRVEGESQKEFFQIIRYC